MTGRPRPRASGAEDDVVPSVPEGAKLEESGRLWESGTILFARSPKFTGTERVGSLELVGAAEMAVVLFVVLDVSPSSSGCH